MANAGPCRDPRGARMRPQNAAPAPARCANQSSRHQLAAVGSICVRKSALTRTSSTVRWLGPIRLSASGAQLFSFGPHTRTMSPSDAGWQQLISALHASGRKAALAITGGGTGAVGECVASPGLSAADRGAGSLRRAGACDVSRLCTPAQACSADTAIAMARAVRARAARVVPAGTDLVGLGVTAALVSDRPRKGEHRFHIAYANSASHRALHGRDGQGPT